MIYLFAGDDPERKIKNYEKFLKDVSARMQVFHVARNNMDPLEIESFYSGSGLFFNECAVVFSGVLEREDKRSFVLQSLEAMALSPNTFVFIEGKLLKSVLDEFRKARAEVNYFELPKEKHEKFNNFLLANALGERDKKNLWIYYRQAVDRGVGLEELVGVMFWKVKDMNTKRFFGKWKGDELRQVGEKLSYLLPEARRKGKDAETAFERFILEIF
ncbi:MAG: hypothetical protein ACKOW9_00865 [Candidatus Paceibacterota bacterium]